MVDWPDIIRTHGPLVWRTAYRLLGNDADANDCYQDTFITAVKRADHEVVANWPGYLVRLTTHRAIDMMRRSARHQRRCNALAAEPTTNAGHVDPTADLARQEQIEQLRTAIAQLPKDHAVVVSLHYFSGWTHQQIAEHTHSQTGAVRVRLHRIRQRLRELMEANVNPVTVRVAT